MSKDTEQKVINHLQRYRDVCNRIKVLSCYSVGAGITINRLSEDDELQQLHAQLRGKPSYMYLSMREQDVLSAATANMTSYPAGTRAQLHEVAHTHSADPIDERRLRELEKSVRKVIEARTGVAEGFEGVLNKVTELQDLLAERANTNAIFDVMRETQSNLADLLHLRYVQLKQVQDITQVLAIERRTYKRWHDKAVAEFSKLSGMRGE